MPRTSKRTLLSDALHALKYHASKYAVRDDLPDGFETDCVIDVHATFGKQIVQETIAGRLSVGHDSQSASTSKADDAHVVAWLLDQLTQSDQQDLMKRLLSHKKLHGELPEVGKAAKENAKLLLNGLRDQVTVTRRGTVRFEPKTD